MHPSLRQRQYQQQAITTASPERLVSKLYELGVSACHRGDRTKTRAVLVELMGSLNHEQGGELAGRLHAIYEFCLNESALGDLNTVAELLGGLREAWHDGVLARPAAAA
jgi:flagellar protein FliS